MTVRVALAAVFALALLAAAQPAVDHATRTRDAAAVGASADPRRPTRPRPSTAARPPDAPSKTAPRRALRLDLPTDASLAVRDGPPRLVSTLPGRPKHQRTLPVPVETCGNEATLDGPTTLAYVDRPNGSVVLALRGFIRGNATTASHACAPRPLRGARPRLRL
ncbi:hypothetical protein [Halobacterium sp. CBA1126]|uniref:DUF7311 family protein n=1 Tax=Halobacterium sp. CBA1126 TaxID=2668074 RepID=UPI0012F72266|nr:hypothetical protein [Halobacterium sp. CBA1126]MUV61857.1 hypothetical protein [Halobacterium sp. CBA1126]